MSSFGSRANDHRQRHVGYSNVTPEIAAEAAAWMASLHGPDRCRDMEDEFRSWLKQSEVHREVFEKMTDIWQAIPGTQAAITYAQAQERAKRNGRRARNSAWRWAGSAAMGLLAVAAVLVVLAEGSTLG
jgi:transmembrane sensor